MTGLGAQCCFVSYITYYRKDHCMNIVSIIYGVMIQEYIKFITAIQERDFFLLLYSVSKERRGVYFIIRSYVYFPLKAAYHNAIRV